MTVVYSRIQATEANYMEKVTKELDEDNNGLKFDFSSNNNAISVEYGGKLIALVEKQGGDYIIERVAGTPQPSEVITQETKHIEDIDIDIDIDTQRTHTGTGGDGIRLTPKKDNIIKVNFG